MSNRLLVRARKAAVFDTEQLLRLLSEPRQTCLAPEAMGVPAGVQGAAGSSVAPPVFVSKSEQTRTTGVTNLTVAAPASITDGNTLYLFVWNKSSGAAAATCTGFTQVYHNSAAGPTLTILKKTAASESGSYSVASTTSNAATAQMLNYSGGYGTEDVVGTLDRSGGNIATATASSITALTAGVLLAAFYMDNTSTVTTAPSGMTQRAFINTDRAVAVYELSPSSAGVTGTKALVYSTANFAHGAILMQIE